MLLPAFVIKRSNKKAVFDKEKIRNSIITASKNVGKFNKNLIDSITDDVFKYISEVYPLQEPLFTSDIGSAVEKVLVTRGQYEIVKEFILAREEKRKVYIKKQELGVKDDIGGLSYNSLFILKERYLKKDSKGKTIETPKQMLERVAKTASQTEKTKTKKDFWYKKFFNIMKEMKFLPGTRALANAGKKFPQMANCFVFDINDSVESIFKTLYESSLTKKYGGGCGYNFSKLRPKGDSVGGEPGLAAGPISIMQMFDLPTGIFRQQGRYESGNMSILNVDHPDIMEFIACKEKDGILPKTNISVGIFDDFMEAVRHDRNWELKNPRTGKIVNKIKAKALFELIAVYAHKSGDPGLIFLDTINKNNPTLEGIGPILATNPCGEEPLYPYESCNLGYINLTKFVNKDKKGKISFDFDNLAEVSSIATRFMDNVIDVSWFPIKEQNTAIKKNFRRIGIGVTGWADVLVDFNIPYNDNQAFKFAQKVMKTISDACHKSSLELGKEKGPFDFAIYSKWAKSKIKPRNIMTNTLPPSSGNAVIFDTSFSLEPYFALAFSQNVLGGVKLENINQKLISKLKERSISIDSLFEKIARNNGSIQHLEEIPKDIKKIFLTAHDISWKDHIKMQASWQKYVDNAITKTINMPTNATVDDVEKAYMFAWESGCKGITIYRDNSKENQVIEFTEKNELKTKRLNAGDPCPKCKNPLIKSEGCVKCLSCGFSLCEL